MWLTGLLFSPHGVAKNFVAVVTIQPELKSREVDSNHRPLGYEPSELTICSTPRAACYCQAQAKSPLLCESGLADAFFGAVTQAITPNPLFKVGHSRLSPAVRSMIDRQPLDHQHKPAAT